jgi:DNA-binding transcriptional LysR family regulator
VLEALYYLAPGVPVVGLLQARRERKPGFQVPEGVAEDIVGELENEYVVCGVFPSRVLLSSSPRPGVRPPFYRSRGRRITCAPRYLAMWGKHDVLCYRVGGRPDDLRSDLVIMAYLVPEQWRFEGWRAADGGDVLR